MVKEFQKIGLKGQKIGLKEQKIVQIELENSPNRTRISKKELVSRPERTKKDKEDQKIDKKGLE